MDVEEFSETLNLQVNSQATAAKTGSSLAGEASRR
jgi:hypothetical protein